MATTTIFFRGRNTDGIITDARAYGLANGNVVIVARDGDALAKPGDRFASDFVGDLAFSFGGDITIVANGGTTAQAAPIISRVAFEAGRGRVSARVVEIPLDGRLIVHADFAPAKD